MKTNLQLAKSVFFRLICFGVLAYFIYIVFTALTTAIFTKEIGARVYEIVDGKYNLVSDVTFKNKFEFTPPKGENVFVEYYRSEETLTVKIVSRVIIQAISFFLLFTVLSPILGKQGHLASSTNKGLRNGFKIGIIAAIPSFCVYLGFVIATALKLKLAYPAFCILNVTFRPIIDIISILSHNQHSLVNALLMILVVLVIPLITQITFKFGYKFQNIDLKKYIYKKEEK